MLPKHPDQYSNEEMEAWIRHLVDDKVGEGPRLDYKETLSLGRDKQNVEAAKDVSSFANEIGGTIIYGIPEDRQSDEIAVPCRQYGIDPVPDIESRLDNVYVDSISPHLPELRIRKLELTEYAGKVVYLVWTPESWLGPHMVHAHRDKRYYRRGQLRAVPMDEHEVRERYERRRSLYSALEDFMTSPELNYVGRFFPDRGFVSHYVACPALLVPDRFDLGATDMRDWLGQNPYGPLHWGPTAYGVRGHCGGHWPSSVEDDWCCSEIYRNGAISYWERATIKLDDRKGKHYFMSESEQHVAQGFLDFARQFYERVQYFGPVVLQFSVENRSKSTLWLSAGADHQLVTHDDNLWIRVTVSSSQLFEDSKSVSQRLMGEVRRAFGIW